MLRDQWIAPAKLNLMLHITGQRADGYHLLQTVFQFLDRGDTLSFELRDDNHIVRLTALPGVEPDQDIVIKAARLLQQQSEHVAGVSISLDKVLPMGAGLGGGSSDAATTLVALNQIWGLNLPTERLAELGLQLGADVPVFVHGNAAWAEGVGEDLQPITLPEHWFLVINPNIAVATAEVFADKELTRDCSPITIRAFLAGQGSNVCEPVVKKHYPEVAKALNWLDKFARARMTGTGASIFASFDTEDEAEQVLKKLPKQWQGFVAKGRNKSPLFD